MKYLYIVDYWVPFPSSEYGGIINVIAENDRQVTMRIVGKESSKINKSDIQSREVMPTSLMPVGILETIQENEVLDLVKYLQTMKPKS